MALVSCIGSARTGSPASTWWLSHPWDSPSDLAALSLCRMAMRPWGIELVDGSVIAGESPGIVKMHGMEMVESTQPLFDLRQVALAQQWAQRLPTWIRRYMQRGESWHGIPMGIHQANVAWVNADCVQALGGIWPNTFSSWLRWLEHLRPKIRYPLALGGQLWQIGVLFESVVLSVAGPDLYRRAFVELQPSVWCESALQEAVQGFLALRRYVDEASLGLSWSAQWRRVHNGEAAVLVMGDWAGALDSDKVLARPVPGTAGQFVAIVDFLVPLAHSPVSWAEQAAQLWTQAEFQHEFAKQKSCRPAMPADGAPERRPHGRVLGGEIVGEVLVALPSLTFEQSCDLAPKEKLLRVVTEQWMGVGCAQDCVKALSSVAFTVD